MSEVPRTVSDSGLWKRLSDAPELQAAMEQLRSLVAQLAAKIAEQLPEFTDHSVKHLDALWRVTDTILTPAEIAALSSGEAFVLGAALYLHDLGMTTSATTAGADSLRNSSVYKSTLARLLSARIPKERAKVLALRNAGRALHAEKAVHLATEKMPGLDRYLIENTELREHWGMNIGQVAASHHWAIAEIERALGARGRVPDARGGTTDLGYIACVLRIVDYAHINLERASTVERLLRPHLPADSVMHWDAQQNITGPIREDNQLVFGATRPTSSVDGWWTFYEMANGLDTEITAVREYLNGRAVSLGRFSLEGVKGAKTPQNFAVLVPPDQFEPVDVRFRPNSMERLITILGGRTLYGGDHFAPIRELIQNARDAVTLYHAALSAQGLSREEGEIGVSIERQGTDWYLAVTDTGVGMSAYVITNYLLGIAADYWSSGDFYSEHPYLTSTRFRPVGRFGIGFLSVFMLGDNLEVTTQRRGGDQLVLRLQGVGRRGALLKRPATFRYGTSVRVRISPEMAGDLDDLRAIVMAKAPMLAIPVAITHPSGRGSIDPGWWQRVSQEELAEFLARQPVVATTPARIYRANQDRAGEYFRKSLLLGKAPRLDKWPGRQPELLTESARILAVPSAGHVLLCSKGFAIRSISMPGMLGIVDIGEVELNAARSETLGWDATSNRSAWLHALRPHLISALNELVTEGDIPGRFRFIAHVAQQYGSSLLLETNLPWITLRESPGHSTLISSATLLDKLRTTSELLVIYGEGVSPWNSESAARTRYPSASRDALVLAVPNAGQAEVGSYEDHDEVIEAPLAEHFGTGRYRSGSVADAVLLNATLELVAQEWQCPQFLSTVTWRRHNRRISAHLKRPGVA